MQNKPKTITHPFLKNEASGGLVLFAASLLALLIANTPAAPLYFDTLSIYVAGLSLQHWINDGLMTLFFLLVGLEIKRELLTGELSTRQKRILPGVAAVSGMAVPALIFTVININEPANLRGWAIPVATDIAFALGVLALLGNRVPASLKILLTAIAVLDDLLAIIVIAVFYTDSLSFAPLGAAVLGLGILTLLNRRGVTSLWPYLVIGSGLWLAVLLSGVHATLAGVALALTIPLDPKKKAISPLTRLEKSIHYWVVFLVLPVFGFANAGVTFEGMTYEQALAPLSLGIALGLFLGKQFAIFGSVFALVRLNMAPMPRGATWRHIYGMALLCGIGFTISLFIGNLAFETQSGLLPIVKISVLAASVLSGLIGFAVLRHK